MYMVHFNVHFFPIRRVTPNYVEDKLRHAQSPLVQESRLADGDEPALCRAACRQQYPTLTFEGLRNTGRLCEAFGAAGTIRLPKPGHTLFSQILWIYQFDEVVLVVSTVSAAGFESSRPTIGDGARTLSPSDRRGPSGVEGLYPATSVVLDLHQVRAQRICRV